MFEDVFLDLGAAEDSCGTDIPTRGTHNAKPSNDTSLIYTVSAFICEFIQYADLYQAFLYCLKDVNIPFHIHHS